MSINASRFQDIQLSTGMYTAEQVNQYVSEKTVLKTGDSVVSGTTHPNLAAHVYRANIIQEFMKRT